MQDDVNENDEQDLDMGEAHPSTSKAGKLMAIDSGSSLTSATSAAAVVPRGRVSKRRKNAEERAAQIRARNRRAQQVH